MLRKASAVEEETKWAAWLYHWCNQAIYLTAGVTVMSLFASPLQKISMHVVLWQYKYESPDTHKTHAHAQLYVHATLLLHER